MTDAMHGSELTTIIAKVEAKGPAAYVTDLSLLENRFQFRRHIQSLKRSYGIGAQSGRANEECPAKLVRCANVSHLD